MKKLPHHIQLFLKRKMDESGSWPCASSSVLARIPFRVPVVDILEYYKVRDLLLGENGIAQDVSAALFRAASCKHPDAVWLHKICAGKLVTTNAQLLEVLLAHENDVRAQGLLACLNRDILMLERAVAGGNAHAMAWMAFCRNDFRLAQESASLLERMGFFRLGVCYATGHGCERDVEQEKRNFLIAAELGHFCAARNYGSILEETDPMCWIWLGRAARGGYPKTFLSWFAQHVHQFFVSGENGAVLFEIGRALKGQINMERKEIFGRNDDNEDDEDDEDVGVGDYVFVFAQEKEPARMAVEFFEAQRAACRLAVDAWTLVGIRLRICKDVRKLIAKKIWASQGEAAFDVGGSIMVDAVAASVHAAKEASAVANAAAIRASTAQDHIQVIAALQRAIEAHTDAVVKLRNAKRN